MIKDKIIKIYKFKYFIKNNIAISRIDISDKVAIRNCITFIIDPNSVVKRFINSFFFYLLYFAAYF